MRDRLKSGVIGVDISAGTIACVQVAGPASSPRAVAAGLIDRPAGSAEEVFGGEEAQRLVDLLDRRGFVGHRVAVCVPTPHVMSGMLELPPRESGAPLDQIAQAEMARMHRCDPGAFELALWDLPQSARASEGTAVFAAGCSHEHAEALLRPLDEVGLEPVVLDLRTCALARACPTDAGRAGSIAAILELGWSSARLVVLHEGCVIYERVIGTAGLGSLVGQIEASLDLTGEVVRHALCTHGLVPPAQGTPASGWEVLPQLREMVGEWLDEICKECHTSFSYALHRYPEAEVDRVLLSGEGARIAGTASHISDRFEAEATPLSLATRAKCPPGLREAADDPRYGVALGLALRGAA